jgi:glycosyltransferase involved in cell wall biosynthesis
MQASIVIATRNREPQLKVAFPTVMMNGYRDGVEVVVVDDGSTDGSEEVFTTFEPLLGNGLTVHRINRAGGWRRNPGGVFNTGHALAKGDVVIEQGGEVAHLNDCVGPMVAACKPGVMVLATVYDGTPEDLKRVQAGLAAGTLPIEEDVLVGPNVIQTNGDRIRAPRVNIGDRGRPVRMFTGKQRQAPFMFLGAVHREDWEAVNGYREDIDSRNDQDLAERLIKERGMQFLFLGKAVGFHLTHGKA